MENQEKKVKKVAHEFEYEKAVGIHPKWSNRESEKRPVRQRILVHE